MCRFMRVKEKVLFNFESYSKAMQCWHLRHSMQCWILSTWSRRLRARRDSAVVVSVRLKSVGEWQNAGISVPRRRCKCPCRSLAVQILDTDTLLRHR